MFLGVEYLPTPSHSRPKSGFLWSLPSCLARTCSLSPGWSVEGAAGPGLPRPGLPSLPQPRRGLEGDRWGCQTFLALPTPHVGPCWAAGIPGILTQPRAGSVGRAVLGCRAALPSVLADLLCCWGRGGSVCKLRVIALAKLGWQCWL